MKAERMSVEEFKAFNCRKPKYGNASVIEAGYRFSSKLEAARFRYWSNLWHAGAIAWFTRQVPFYLPGGIVYRCDFFAVMLGRTGPKDDIRDPGAIIVEDCKGVMTRVSLNKIKQVEEIYGLKVHIIKRGDFK